MKNPAPHRAGCRGSAPSQVGLVRTRDVGASRAVVVLSDAARPALAPFLIDPEIFWQPQLGTEYNTLVVGLAPPPQYVSYTTFPTEL